MEVYGWRLAEARRLPLTEMEMCVDGHAVVAVPNLLFEYGRRGSCSEYRWRTLAGTFIIMAPCVPLMRH